MADNESTPITSLTGWVKSLEDDYEWLWEDYQKLSELESENQRLREKYERLTNLILSGDLGPLRDKLLAELVAQEADDDEEQQIDQDPWRDEREAYERDSEDSEGIDERDDCQGDDGRRDSESDAEDAQNGDAPVQAETETANADAETEWPSTDVPLPPPTEAIPYCSWHLVPGEGDPNSLREITRTDDTAFYQQAPGADGVNVFHQPASLCYVPYDIERDLLNKAHMVAKRALWDAMEKYWPRERSIIYPESSHQVVFGMQELAGTLDRCELKVEEGDGRPRFFNAWAIRKLRNAVSHPERRPYGWSNNSHNFDVDALLASVHQLVVGLQDEDRSHELRKMRDEFQTEIVKSYTELEAMLETPHFQQAKPWQIHHHVFISSLRRKPPGSLITYGDVVRKAIRLYKWEYSHRGKLSDEFRVTLDAAKPFVEGVVGDLDARRDLQRGERPTKTPTDDGSVNQLCPEDDADEPGETVTNENRTTGDPVLTRRRSIDFAKEIVGRPTVRRRGSLFTVSYVPGPFESLPPLPPWTEDEEYELLVEPREDPKPVNWEGIY